MHLTAGPKCFCIALALFIVPCRALTKVDGRLPGSFKQTGTYDLLVQVWNTPANSGKLVLSQTVQIPKVEVVDGSFTIALSAGLEGRKESDFSIRMQARPFEALKPFESVEVSRVQNDAKPASSLVFR